MKIRRLFAWALATAALLSGQAAYADIRCQFNLGPIYAEPNGWTVVWLVPSDNSYQLGFWICSVSGSVTVNTGYVANETITSDACKSIYSLLLTARSRSAPVFLEFKNATACTQAQLSNVGGANFPYNISM